MAGELRLFMESVGSVRGGRAFCQIAEEAFVKFLEGLPPDELRVVQDVVVYKKLGGPKIERKLPEFIKTIKDRVKDGSIDTPINEGHDPEAEPYDPR